MFAIIVQNAGKSQVLDDHKSADNTETVKGTGHWYPYIVSFTSTTGQVVHSSLVDRSGSDCLASAARARLL